ncbi:MAG: NADPH-dependent F420 reductase [Dehalococcoidia bacterium]
MIGIIGGTGSEGKALAVRLASIGDEVIIGSRDEAKAKAVAENIRSKSSKFKINGMSNFNAAQNSELVIITVPYNSQKNILNEIKSELANKIVINTVVPLIFKNSKVSLSSVTDGSAALEAKNILTNSFVIAAFQTISSDQLIDLEVKVTSDVIVCGDDLVSKRSVAELINRMNGLRAIDAGSLYNSIYIENLTCLLVNINKVNKVNSAVQITGI